MTGALPIELYWYVIMMLLADRGEVRACFNAAYRLAFCTCKDLRGYDFKHEGAVHWTKRMVAARMIDHFGTETSLLIEPLFHVTQRDLLIWQHTDADDDAERLNRYRESSFVSARLLLADGADGKIDELVPHFFGMCRGEKKCDANRVAMIVSLSVARSSVCTVNDVMSWVFHIIKKDKWSSDEIRRLARKSLRYAALANKPGVIDIFMAFFEYLLAQNDIVDVVFDVASDITEQFGDTTGTPTGDAIDRIFDAPLIRDFVETGAQRNSAVRSVLGWISRAFMWF